MTLDGVGGALRHRGRGVRLCMSSRRALREAEAIGSKVGT